MLDVLKTGLLRKSFGALRERLAAPSEPLAERGYEPSGPYRLLDRLTDEELRELNGILDWNCFLADGLGRRFGKSARTGKRDRPQEMPDRRVAILEKRFRTADKHVLEVGCFEGVHTAGLCRIAKQVTGVDSRIENVVKAMVRTAFLDTRPRLFPCDLERRPLPEDLLKSDVLYHVGVLYHLVDPVRHLKEMLALTTTGILLDTHVADATDADEHYTVDGVSYPYRRYREYGKSEVFSGMGDHSKWLTLETLESLLRENGFSHLDILERRNERHGKRVLLTAGRLE